MYLLLGVARGLSIEFGGVRDQSAFHLTRARGLPKCLVKHPLLW